MNNVSDRLGRDRQIIIGRFTVVHSMFRGWLIVEGSTTVGTTRGEPEAAGIRELGQR